MRVRQALVARDVLKHRLTGIADASTQQSRLLGDTLRYAILTSVTDTL